MSAHAPQSSVWIGTGYLDWNDPDPDLLDLPLIIRSLSRECRWSGLTERSYTVAEHSAAVAAVAHDLVARVAAVLCDERAAVRHALTHDFPEFVLRDLATPFKRECEEYNRAHARIARAVDARFGIFDGLSPYMVSRVEALVADADAMVGATEKAILMPDAPAWDMAEPHPLGIAHTEDPAALLARLCAEWGIE